MIDGIRAEREVLGPATRTGGRRHGHLGPHRRDAATADHPPSSLAPRESHRRLALTLLTFGFKNGPPRDADLMFDVRFLPNPHYREDLRPLTGLDAAVVEHVEAGELASEFYARAMALLDFLLPPTSPRARGT